LSLIGCLEDKSRGEEVRFVFNWDKSRQSNLPSTGTKHSTKYYLPKNCILSPLNENDMKKGEFFT
jgi:hypothetical protein